MPDQNGSGPDHQLITTMVPFQHPPGFKPIRILIMALQQDGTFFVNMPTNPSESLALGLLVMQEVVKQAIATLQAKATDGPRILAPPPEGIPPYRGPKAV